MHFRTDGGGEVGPVPARPGHLVSREAWCDVNGDHCLRSVHAA
jgi:hypothetical protein